MCTIKQKNNCTFLYNCYSFEIYISRYVIHINISFKRSFKGSISLMRNGKYLYPMVVILQ